jgi:hypothetical protein
MRHQRLAWALVFITIVLTMVATSPVAVAESATLKSGDWWTVNGTVQRTATGSGSDSGEWTLNGTYVDKYTVLSRDDKTVMISFDETGSWSTTATKTWVSPNGGATNTGPWSSTITYTIDAAALKVKAVSNKDYNDVIGHPSWIILNAKGLSQGSSVQLGWEVPSSDAKSSTYTDVPWNVDKQVVNFKGMNLNVWSLTHAGDDFGYWRSGNVHSKGTLTETSLYDTSYGIYLGDSRIGNYAFARTGGGWTETCSQTEKPADTSLSFSVAMTLEAKPHDAMVTVDGVDYTGGQFPKVFTWNTGSTHTLQVNATIDAGNGVRYVFVQWDDGSKDTSRTVTASETGSYTATFKTQYELKVASDLGDPQGSGWYDAGSQATFSVTTPQPETGFFSTLGGKATLQRWTGDSTDSSPTASVQMDGPKTVTAKWTTDDSQPYMILGGLAAAVLVVIVVAVVMMRRKGRPATSMQPTLDTGPPRVSPSQVVPPAVAPPPVVVLPPKEVRGKERVPAPSGSPPGTKYCVFCGHVIPMDARFCTNINCGKPQD